ncbi:MAG TPA: ATP-binding cassette domain-containing protein [Rhodopila sp.]
MLDAHIAAKRLPTGEMLLRAIDLAVGPGEILALLGASGTGKTATLRILLGLDRQFEGSVHCAAVRPGAVFQEPCLLPWRSVGDNIRLVTGNATPAVDVAGLLRDIGLPGVEALYPRQLSLGMARRVALARALAIAPDLLVLDEPFASLDPHTSGLIAQRVARYVRDRGAALVFTTHDVERATALATRVLVISGRPATAAARLEVSRDAGEAQRAADRAMLERTFPFLTHPNNDGAAQGTEPAASRPPGSDGPPAP